MSLSRNPSPGTAARRSLLADLLAALILTLLTFKFAAGIGVVGFIALLLLLVLLPWIAVEATVHKLGRRRKAQRARSRR
ncbi:MAG: hypothetical protein QOF85_1359 [Solirubrobacterales bacterium]|nr:hypothetical protein [Solirubrobacterales bacterium]